MPLRRRWLRRGDTSSVPVDLTPSGPKPDEHRVASGSQIDYPGDGLSIVPPVTDFRTAETGGYKVNSDCTGFQEVDLGAAGPSRTLL